VTAVTVNALVRARLWVDQDGDVLLNEIPLYGGSRDELISKLGAWIRDDRQALVVTTNVDQVLDFERRDDSRHAYANADVVLIDGMPVSFLARALGAKRADRITGAELLPAMVSAAQETGWRIAIAGGAPEVAEAAVQNLKVQYPAATVQAVPFPLIADVRDLKSEAVVSQLREFKPDVVFLCLGAPKQEAWYGHWRAALPAGVYIGAGAAVDFAAGRASRAPGWAQAAGLEWAWRLGQEPRRLARRYLVKGPKFMRIIIRSFVNRGTY
jgi:N-acetylglucosaminyldiphosphoundecaprenol N-acetyl-beta-D-mannosaminyltransferase